jgi:hypothetical protein
MVDRELEFGRVLSDTSSEKRTFLIIIPVVVAIAIVIGFAVVAISRMSSLSTQVSLAKQQAEEAQKATDEKDRQLRDARAETALLGSAGQGAAVLAAASKDSGASGIALAHPEQHAVNVYAFNLPPAPDGQEYRLIVSDMEGHEKLAGALNPDDRGGAFLLARDLPEGVTKVELALLAKGAGAQAGEAKQGGAQPAAGQQQTPAQRQTVLSGSLPKPGEAGVVMASAPQDQQQQGAKAQGRAGGGKRRR